MCIFIFKDMGMGMLEEMWGEGSTKRTAQFAVGFRSGKPKVGIALTEEQRKTFLV